MYCYLRVDFWHCDFLFGLASIGLVDVRIQNLGFFNLIDRAYTHGIHNQKVQLFIHMICKPLNYHAPCMCIVQVLTVASPCERVGAVQISHVTTQKSCMHWCLPSRKYGIWQLELNPSGLAKTVLLPRK